MDNAYLFLVFWLAVIYISLLNCITYRYVKNSDLKFTALIKSSTCEQCSERIRFPYYLPLIGFLLATGKSKCCQAKIPRKHFFIELLGGLITVVAWWLMKEKGLVVTFLFFALIAVAVIDLKKQIIPFVFTVPVFISGFYFLPYTVPLEQRWYGAICGFLLTTLAMSFVSFLKKENVIAGGDIALITCAGVWLGIHMVPLFILVTALLFIIHALPERLNGSLYTPMGPSICLGYSICLIFHLIC